MYDDAVIFWLFILIGSCFSGFICDRIAVSQGRKYGFVLGFFFGIWAIIAYLIAGKTIEKQAEDLKKLQSLMKE